MPEKNSSRDINELDFQKSTVSKILKEQNFYSYKS